MPKRKNQNEIGIEELKQLDFGLSEPATSEELEEERNRHKIFLNWLQEADRSLDRLVNDINIIDSLLEHEEYADTLYSGTDWIETEKFLKNLYKLEKMIKKHHTKIDDVIAVAKEHIDHILLQELPDRRKQRAGEIEQYMQIIEKNNERDKNEQ